MSDLILQAKTQNVAELDEFQTEEFSPTVTKVKDALQLSATVLQRETEVLQQQKTEQELLVQQWMASLTSSLRDLTSMVEEFSSEQMTKLEWFENNALQQKKLDEEMFECLKRRQVLMEQANDDAVVRRKAVCHFKQQVTSKLTEIQDGATQKEKDLLSVTTLNCTNNQHDVSQVLEQVEMCSSLNEKVTTSVRQHHCAQKQAWEDHFISTSNKLEEHEKQHEQHIQEHDRLSQTLQEDLREHTEKITDYVQDRGQKFMEDVKDEQTELAAQISGVSEWSNTNECDMKQRVHEVNIYVTDEMKKDKPTGKTPQRRNFSYPQNPTKTKDHEVILQTFRSTYIQHPLDPLATNLSHSLEAVAESLDEQPVKLLQSEEEQNDDGVSETGSDHSCSSTTSGVSGLSSYSKASKESSKENRSKTSRLPSRNISRKQCMNNINTTPRGTQRNKVPLKNSNQEH